MLGKSNFAVFIFASLLLHVLLISQYRPELNFKVDGQPQARTITFSKKVRISFVSPTISAEKSAVNNFRQTNKSMVKQQARAVKKNRAVRKNPVTEKPVIKTENTEKIKKNIPDVKTEQASSAQQIASKKIFKVKQNLYLKKIIASIEKNKYYPTLARRRNMQDIVAVSFNLVSNAEVENLKISGNHKVLRNAARAAIYNSLPFNRPPQEVSFPLNVKYSMAFSLE